MRTKYADNEDGDEVKMMALVRTKYDDDDDDDDGDNDDDDDDDDNDDDDDDDDDDVDNVDCSFEIK